MKMDSDDQTLTLGLGFPSSPNPNHFKAIHVKQPPFDQAEPSLTLSLEFSGETFPAPHQELSATSSHSNNLPAPPPTFVSVKREREITASDEEEDGSPTTTAADAATATRKKLRLTKEQSAHLEDSFKQHSTLNPKQKQALADRLNLRPRQVEVWFQNRRARTKLKQTEVDCEQLKKCCENLTDENRRLQKELQELKALKLGHPLHHNFYMQLAAPAATLTMCPSCSSTGVPVPVPIAAATPNSNNPLAFTLGPGSGPKTHFYSSFPNPSAAC